MNCLPERGFQMARVGVAILAGGQGRRMGGSKPERQFRGRRLIDPALDLVSAWRVPAAICVREPGQVANSNFAQILDWPEIEGPLSGLLSALEWARAEGVDYVLTLPCDAPFLPADLLSKLLPIAVGTARPVVASSKGRRHPTCAVWPVELLSRVAAYAEAGRRSLSGALEACDTVEVRWADCPLDVFENINSPEDIARLQD